MALTPKQEYFCRLVASGKDYTTAYLTAYDWNGSKAGAANESLILANKPEIQEKIKTLIKPMEIAAQKESVNARQQRIDFILERIRICEEKEDEQSLIRWNDQLCKIYALYKETETEQKPESTVNNLDISVLKRLSHTTVFSTWRCNTWKPRRNGSLTGIWVAPTGTRQTRSPNALLPIHLTCLWTNGTLLSSVSTAKKTIESLPIKVWQPSTLQKCAA